MKKLNLPVEEIARRYLAGETVLQLAREYGCYHPTIIARLEEAGVKRRPRGLQRINKPTKNELSDALHRACVRLTMDGRFCPDEAELCDANLICLEEECDNNGVGCWEKYFLMKAGFKKKARR